MNDPSSEQTQNRTPRKRLGRPAAGESLTPQQVAEAAFQLILAEGEEALTMRRLGDMLGVKAMALYNHFKDKEAILDAVASRAFTSVPLPPEKGHWRTRLKSLCKGIRDMALQQPGVFRLSMTRRTPPSAALPQIESALSALADAGLSPTAQARAFHTLRLYVRGFCLWEIEELRTTQGPDFAEIANATQNYPRTAAVAYLLFTPDADRQFEAGLELILRGLQASTASLGSAR